MMAHNRLPHALLITGAPQIGKFEFAQVLIKTLLCTDKQAGVACDHCAPCRSVARDNPQAIWETQTLIRRSNYPNLLYCRTELNDKGVLSKNIRIDQIRTFCEALGKTADGLQIGVLFYADEMNVNAANSLLKTLEEPRANTLIILLAHHPKNLPKTIVSRCQNVHIPPAFDAPTQRWLATQMSTTQTADFEVGRLLENAHGVPFKVISELNGDEFMRYQAWQNQLLSIALHPLQINQTKAFDGFELAALKCLQNLLIEGIKLKMLGRKGGLVELNQVVENVNPDFLFRLLDDVAAAIRLAKTSVNMKLLLDNVLIVWSHITHLKTYPKITEKI